MIGDMTIAGMSVSTLIVGCIQLIKKTFPKFDTKWAPLISLIMGFGFAFLYNMETHQYSTFQTTIMGLGVGLQAIGIFSASSNTAKNSSMLAKLKGNSKSKK